jgi:LacI family transcriptional regulator
MASVGAAVRPEWSEFDALTAESATEVARRMLALPDAPTALFTAQNLITMGAVRALRERGLQHDVAVVGFDDFMLADLLDPGVTVVAQDPREMGHLAASRPAPTWCRAG